MKYYLECCVVLTNGMPRHWYISLSIFTTVSVNGMGVHFPKEKEEFLRKLVTTGAIDGMRPSRKVNVQA